MVVSLKSKKFLAIIVLIALIIGGFLLIPKIAASPMKYYGETATQRLDFLQSFGYELNPEPIDVRQVTIPSVFNDVYTQYNEMQKAQGFDLSGFKGKECTQYIYLVTNYPDNDSEIHATLLVREGVIIGGDVCCAEVDGFMHGFALDSARYGDEPAADEDTEESSETDEAESGAESTDEETVSQDEEISEESSEDETAEADAEKDAEGGAEETFAAEDEGFPVD